MSRDTGDSVQRTLSQIKPPVWVSIVCFLFGDLYSTQAAIWLSSRGQKKRPTIALVRMPRGRRILTVVKTQIGTPKQLINRQTRGG